MSGGTSPYQYIWSHAPALDTSTVANLDAGSYLIGVVDANGCQLVDSFSLIAPPPINITSAVQDDTCQIGSGQIAMSASGGTGVLTYFWVQAPTHSDSILNNLFPGSYTGIVVDDNGWVDTDMILSGLAGPELQLDSMRMVSCASGADGYLSFAALGGTGPLSYTWSDLGSINQPVRNGLEVGTTN